MENLLGIIQGWYAAGAGEEACTNSNVAERTGYAQATISRQNQFLLSLSILQEDGQQKRLTESGEKYAEALRFDSDESHLYLASHLYEYPASSSIIDFVGIQNPGKEGVIEQLYEITDQNRDSNASIETLYDLFLEAGIFVEEEDGIDAITEREFEIEGRDSADTTSAKEDNSTRDEESTGAGDQDGDVEHSNIDSRVTLDQTSSNIKYRVDINLELTGEDDPARVYKLVSAVKKGLEESSSDKPDSEADSSTVSSGEVDGQTGLAEFE